MTLLLDLAGHNHLSGLGDTAMTHNPQTFTSGPAPVKGKWSRVQKGLLSPDVASDMNQSPRLRSKGESPSIRCCLKTMKRGIQNRGEFKQLGLLQAPGKQFSRDSLTAGYLGLFNYRPLMIARGRERGGRRCQQWKWQTSSKLAWESAARFPLSKFASLIMLCLFRY